MQQQLERARAEVNHLKAHIARAGATADRSMLKRCATAEEMLAKAEASIRRVKHSSASAGARGSGGPPVEGERAQRALAVLKAAPPFHTAVKERIPLREDQLQALYKKASQATKLGIGPIRNDGLVFLCENVFRAYMWFRPIPSSSPSQSGTVVGNKVAMSTRPIEPEWIAVFGIDESGVGKWSASKHAVFGVLTERANAAVRYFWARESNGSDAFIALAKWLALHRTMFSDKCDGRRLAFDASRGYFLPACVRSFDGVGGARFTRGSIPLRSNSSYRNANAAANGTTAQQQQQQAQLLQQQQQRAQAQSGGSNSVAARTAPTKMET